MISVPNTKRLVKTAAFVLLAGALSSAMAHPNQKPKGCGERYNENCRHVQVPDGGSAMVYLLGAGAACLGAMLVRSRFKKQSA